MPYKAVVLRLFESGNISHQQAEKLLEVGSADVMERVSLTGKAKRWQLDGKGTESFGTLLEKVEYNRQHEYLTESRENEDVAYLAQLKKEYGLDMEQFRRVPLYECYMADEITEEQYHAEVLDYEEAHRKLNEQLTAIMENTTVWERALSLRNPWIQQMEQYKTPEALDRNFVKKYIEQVVVTFLGDRQAEISLTMKTQEWKQMLERIELEGTDDGTKE